MADLFDTPYEDEEPPLEDPSPAARPPERLAQHALVRLKKSVGEIVVSVDPLGACVRQIAVTDQVTCQFSQAFAPPLGQLAIHHVPTAAPALGGRGDLARERP